MSETSTGADGADGLSPTAHTGERVELLHHLHPDALDGWLRGDPAEHFAEHDIGRTTVRRVRIQALEEGWIANGPNGSEKTPRYLVTDDGRAIAYSDEETPDDQA